MDNEVTVWSILVFFIVIFVIILCNIKIFKRGNFCNDRVFVKALLLNLFF
jgi:hypothetical protein